jgi:hypothetical protein
MFDLFEFELSIGNSRRVGLRIVSTCDGVRWGSIMRTKMFARDAMAWLQFGNQWYNDTIPLRGRRRPSSVLAFKTLNSQRSTCLTDNNVPRNVSAWICVS